MMEVALQVIVVTFSVIFLNVLNFTLANSLVIRKKVIKRKPKIFSSYLTLTWGSRRCFGPYLTMILPKEVR